MTEYEIADLAVSKVMQIQGLGGLFQGQLDTVGSLVQQFMTVLFAFLAAAHFIGGSLSRRQVVIFTSLYTIWQSWTIVLHTVRGLGIEITLAELQALGAIDERGREITDVMQPLIGITQFSLLSAALIASLYFMWDVRHPKTK